MQIRYKKVLVTGAEGMLGRDLCPILENNDYNVVKTDISSLDITDIKQVISVFEKEQPDIVIHCAAYTNVDKAEDDYDSAHKINAIGTENISKICAEKDIPVVYISTDYVFDGGSNAQRTKPYKPTDETNPINNYGLTKLQGELAVQKYCKKYYIARTSWLYGIHGKNFVETMLGITDIQPEIKVVDDQTGCPTWTVDLSNALISIIKEKSFGIYHVCGSGETTWYGFAKEIFKLSGMDVNLIPCQTQDFPRPAKRPKYSVMDNGGICRSWKDALKDYLSLR